MDVEGNIFLSAKREVRGKTSRPTKVYPAEPGPAQTHHPSSKLTNPKVIGALDVLPPKKPGGMFINKGRDEEREIIKDDAVRLQNRISSSTQAKSKQRRKSATHIESKEEKETRVSLPLNLVQTKREGDDREPVSAKPTDTRLYGSGLRHAACGNKSGHEQGGGGGDSSRSCGAILSTPANQTDKSTRCQASTIEPRRCYERCREYLVCYAGRMQWEQVYTATGTPPRARHGLMPLPRARTSHRFGFALLIPFGGSGVRITK
ncbi:hypothetical protein DFH06DRAFT_1151748 [Mycena polygramma]|nr:hypothetical protein DFH06DRAFT_1151748 [Mycena polygramma]